MEDKVSAKIALWKIVLGMKVFPCRFIFVDIFARYLCGRLVVLITGAGASGVLLDVGRVPCSAAF